MLVLQCPPITPSTTSHTRTPGGNEGIHCHQEEYGTWLISSSWWPHRYMVSTMDSNGSCHVGVCSLQRCRLATGWQGYLTVLHSPVPLQSLLPRLLIAPADPAPTSPAASQVASHTVSAWGQVVGSSPAVQGLSPCPLGCSLAITLSLAGHHLCQLSQPNLPRRSVVLLQWLPIRVNVAMQMTE